MNKWNTLLPGAFSLLFWSIIVQPDLIEAALAAAFFLVVPAVLYVSTVSLPGRTRLCWFGAAWSGALSMMMETGITAMVFAVVWFLFTGYIAWKGLSRLMTRGTAPLEETVVDAGFVYVAIGGAWLVLSRAGTAPLLPYTEVIVDLTAVHFHYAAFLLPVLTGLLGRRRYYREVSGRPLLYRILAAGITAGPILTAVAVDQGPPLEAVLVGMYVVFLYWFAGWSIKEAFSMPLFSKITITISSVILIGTMTLSILYSTGRAAGYQVIGIAGMIPWHGAWNAFAFSILALIGWALVSPGPRAGYHSFPVSRLRGKENIAERIEQNQRLHATDGLIASWDAYKRKDFDPEMLSPLVSAFHTHTDRFRMKADIQWRFSLLYRASSYFSKKMKQINVPPTGKGDMEGKMYSVGEQQDGRPDPRVWLRSHAGTGSPVFTAVYSHHTKEDVTYLNVGLPLPVGVMTGILRPDNGKDGALVLTSRKRSDVCGDEGIYVTAGRWTWKTPLRETFNMKQTKEDILEAEHTMAIGRFRFLRITYCLPLMKSQGSRHDGAGRFAGE
ncbi:YndJ family protein [Salibacterium lacus]|uniref:YndJ family protein n=1 Tax=Salibacterium lacus TaxID=1898109 RepID=A0ABW5T1V6_9BACI